MKVVQQTCAMYDKQSWEWLKGRLLWTVECWKDAGMEVLAWAHIFWARLLTGTNPYLLRDEFQDDRQGFDLCVCFPMI